MKGFRSRMYRQMVVVFFVCFFGIAGAGIYMFLTNQNIKGLVGGRSIGTREVTMSWPAVLLLTIFVFIVGIFLLSRAKKDLNGK